MTRRGAVLVTGASSGIGEASARHLGSLGFEVLAGVRKEEDAERLRGAGLEPVRLDVTDPGSIAEARTRLAGRPLAGLVQQRRGRGLRPARVHSDRGASPPARGQPDRTCRRHAGVPARPSVRPRPDRERLVDRRSGGGAADEPVPRVEVRARGVERLTAPRAPRPGHRGERGRARRREDAHLGEGRGRRRRRGRRDAPGGPRTLRGHDRGAAQGEPEGRRADGAEPHAVAAAVARALTAKRPKTRYLVGRDAKSRAALAKPLPDRAYDALIARALR